MSQMNYANLPPLTHRPQDEPSAMSQASSRAVRILHKEDLDSFANEMEERAMEEQARRARSLRRQD